MKLEDLEQDIDARGLDVVLADIARICWEKADHIRTSYNDRATSAAWARAGTSIRRAADGKSVQLVSGGKS